MIHVPHMQNMFTFPKAPQILISSEYELKVPNLVI